MRPTIDDLIAAGERHLPGLLGIQILEASPGTMTAELPVREELFAPNGYLHAASVVALADTACGYGTVLGLPDGAAGFTTIELKANFVGTAREGRLRVEARQVHAGRTTQYWQATVTRVGDGKPVAHFSCTQLLIYPG